MRRRVRGQSAVSDCLRSDLALLAVLRPLIFDGSTVRTGDGDEPGRAPADAVTGGSDVPCEQAAVRVSAPSSRREGSRG
ncbi:hypothetical protein UK15_36530 [Streptomyces variegatus]|uniref:Uncharacterized protein n=1 Tax=Streptomyces variegatus TaxID=284040 RepID=A0A0M2GHD3_9ACTN|nr:hypothetical protein UK15_36530 [Streptomyces variegatus]